LLSGSLSADVLVVGLLLIHFLLQQYTLEILNQFVVTRLIRLLQWRNTCYLYLPLLLC